MLRKLTTLVLVSALALPACATFHAAPTPVAGVADIASRIEDSAVTLLQYTVTAQKQGLVSEAQVDVVAIAVDKIGRAGLDLRIALDDYKAVKAAGKDVSAQLANVQRIVGDINTSLALIGKAIPSGTVATIDQAVVAIVNILATIQIGATL